MMVSRALEKFAGIWREQKYQRASDKEQNRVLAGLLLAKDESLLFEVLRLGMRFALSQLGAGVPLSARKKLQQTSRAAQELRSAKVRAFDRSVELLDHMSVGNKVLGDCGRGDLFRAAVAEEETAKQATIRSVLFRQLASMVGDGTVRELNDRQKVVALLTKYQEGIV